MDSQWHVPGAMWVQNETTLQLRPLVQAAFEMGPPYLPGEIKSLRGMRYMLSRVWSRECRAACGTAEIMFQGSEYWPTQQ